MRIAYLMLVHQDVKQVYRLVTKLNHEDVDFYIHVDLKAKDAFFDELKSSFIQLPNVHFVERTRCYWGDYSLVKATLSAMKHAHAQDIYDHYVLLSGQDYPIKSNQYIIDFLYKNKENSYMEFNQFPNTSWYEGGFARTKYWHFKVLQRQKNNPSITNRVLSKTWNKVKREIPERKYLKENFQQYGGSQWWILTGEVVEYMLGFLNENKEYEQFFRHVEIPDEIFFQTLVLNSPFKRLVINNNLRYMTWRDSTASPSILTEKDSTIISESFNLFARKFDATKSEMVLNLIDQNTSIETKMDIN